jgi:hypothetical protein
MYVWMTGSHTGPIWPKSGLPDKQLKSIIKGTVPGRWYLASYDMFASL